MRNLRKITQCKFVTIHLLLRVFFFRKRVEVIFDGLIPGQTYVARAMVRPQRGRFVPYNLSQVSWR